MRPYWLAIIVFISSCSSQKQDTVVRNRFLESLRPAEDIGTAVALTSDGRCLFPTFAPGDSLVFFRRLLIADRETAAGVPERESIKPYGINIFNRELYNLSDDYPYPWPDLMAISDLPRRNGEPTIMGIRSPDSGTFAFETTMESMKSKHALYLSKMDSIVQLTYGEPPCFLERFSSTGRYLTAVCGRGPTWIIIFDLERGIGYRLGQPADYIDYMTAFSSDDKNIVFIRSKKEYSLGDNFFGDLWLFKFDH